MSNSVTFFGVVTGASNGRVTVRGANDEPVGQAAMVDGSYEVAVDVASCAVGPDDATLRKALPHVFDEELAETLERGPVELALHVLQQTDPMMLPQADEDQLDAVGFNGTLEIAEDERVVHRHALRLTPRLAGQRVSVDVLVDPPMPELGQDMPSNGLPDSFDALAHQDKLDELWRRCEDGSHNYRPKQQGWLSTAFRGPVAVYESRLREGLADVPAAHFQRPYDLTQPRRKVVHQVGAVAKVRFLPQASPYTGLFAAPFGGLLRCSSSLYTKRFFIPGIALKVPVSGQHSRNMVGLVTMQGQGSDRRFFLGEMVTDVPELKRAPNTPWFAASMLYLGQRRIAKQSEQILEKARRPWRPNVLPLGPFAEVTVDGNRVDEVVAPDRLRLIPTVAVQEQWSDDDRHFFDKLGDIHPETELYVVVAESERHGAAPIGKLVLDTAFLLSRVGDEQLHFGHLFPKPPE